MYSDDTHIRVYCRLYFIFFLAIIDISHAPRVNKIHVCVGGIKADNIMVCVNADTHEDMLKRKGAHPIMNDRLTKDYIDLNSRGERT